MHKEKNVIHFCGAGEKYFALFFIIKAAGSLLAAFFMSLKVTFQNLSLSGVIPIGFFVLLGLLKF